MGALAHYISNPAVTDFQPMNVNYGIMPALEKRVRKRRFRNELLSRRALDAFAQVIARCSELIVADVRIHGLILYKPTTLNIQKIHCCFKK